MQIYFAGKISKKEFLKALLLHNQQLKLLKWMNGSILALFVIGFACMAITGGPLLKVFVQSPLIIIIPLIFITFPWWAPYLQLSSYNQKGNIYNKNLFGEINDAEITINGGSVKSSYQWDAYTSYSIKDDILLLYQGKNCFNIFTKALFTNQEEWDNFQAFIKSKVTSNKK